MTKKIFIILSFVLLLIFWGCDTYPSFNSSSPAIYSSMQLINNSGQTIVQIASRANGETDWINGYMNWETGGTFLVTFGYTVDFSTTEFKIYFENGDSGTKILTMSEYGSYSLTVNHTTDGSQWIFSTL